MHHAADVAIRLACLGLILAWCFVLLRPFVAVALWGAILAVAVRPVHLGLSRRLGGREGMAATLLALAGLALTLGPVSLLAASFVSGVEALATAFAAGRLAPPSPPDGLASVPVVGERLHALWTLASVNLGAALARVAPAMRDFAGPLLALAGSAGLAVLQFAAAVVAAGLLLPRSEGAAAGVSALADRLAPARGAAFVRLAAQTVRNVARGVIGTALLQGLALGAGFLVGGVPFAGGWTFVCIALGIVQIGAGPVVLGVLVYAWTAMDATTALLLTLWLIPATLIDNVLKPLLMAQGLTTPLLVILLGLLGGTLAHGMIGLFVGPVVLSVGWDLLRVWMDPRQIPADA